MRHIPIFAAALTALLTLAAPTRADMVDDCTQADDNDLRIGGCTALIRSGKYSGVDLAAAYSNRGVAYRRVGETSRAIEDYDQALRIDPGHANAYQNRGVAYESLGQYERAVEDWEQAIRIEGASKVRWWQEYMKGKGFYAGAIDGIYGPGTRRGLVACAVDPAC